MSLQLCKVVAADTLESLKAGIYKTHIGVRYNDTAFTQRFIKIIKFIHLREVGRDIPEIALWISEAELECTKTVWHSPYQTEWPQ